MSEPRVVTPPIERIAEEQIYKNRFITLYNDHVGFANGRLDRYFRIIYGDGYPPVVIMPVIGEHTALVRVWRYGTQAWEWGFPRGNAHGSDPEITARIELAEETGAEALELIPLGRVYPESAHIETVVYMYAARVASDALRAVPPDTEEIAEIRWLPPGTSWVSSSSVAWSRMGSRSARLAPGVHGRLRRTGIRCS